jgi:hypothetical protein
MCKVSWNKMHKGNGVVYPPIPHSMEDLELAPEGDGMAYLSTLSGSDKREGLANIEAKGHIK